MRYPRAIHWVHNNSCSPLRVYGLGTSFILTSVLEVGTFTICILKVRILGPKKEDIASPSECQAGIGRWAFLKWQSMGYDSTSGLIVTVWALVLTPVLSFYLVICLIPPIIRFLFGDWIGLAPANTQHTGFILPGLLYIVPWNLLLQFSPPLGTPACFVGLQCHLCAFHHWKRSLDAEDSSLIMFLAFFLKPQLLANLSLCVPASSWAKLGLQPNPILYGLSEKLQPYFMYSKI